MGIVGNHNQSLPLFLNDISHQGQNLFSGMGIQVSGGFVRKNNLRIYHQGPGNTHSLLLSSGHLVGRTVGFFADVHKLQIFQSLFVSFLFGNSSKHQRHGYIFHGIQKGNQIVALENEAYMHPSKSHKLFLIHFFNGLSGNGDAALAGLFQTCQHIQAG